MTVIVILFFSEIKMTVSVIASLVIITIGARTVAPDYHRLCSNYHCSYPQQIQPNGTDSDVILI